MRVYIAAILRYVATLILDETEGGGHKLCSHMQREGSMGPMYKESIPANAASRAAANE